MKYGFGNVTFDTDLHEIVRGSTSVHISPKAIQLLTILLEQRPRVVTRQELYDRLWPDTFVGDSGLPVLVREIRDALGDDEHTIIRTVHKVGYSFAASAIESSASSAAPHMLVYEGREYRLAPGENVVGRDSGIAVSILASTVSRRHAVITIADDQATIVDLQSKNGTTVDGRAASQPILLADGAIISLGGTPVIYRFASPSMATETLQR